MIIHDDLMSESMPINEKTYNKVKKWYKKLEKHKNETLMNTGKYAGAPRDG